MGATQLTSSVCLLRIWTGVVHVDMLHSSGGEYEDQSPGPVKKMKHALCLETQRFCQSEALTSSGGEASDSSEGWSLPW